MVQPLWMAVLMFLRKPNILLHYDPGMPALGMYPKELETYVYTKKLPTVVVAALFLSPKTWKQTRCPVAGAWMNSGTPSDVFFKAKKK